MKAVQLQAGAPAEGQDGNIFLFPYLEESDTKNCYQG